MLFYRKRIINPLNFTIMSSEKDLVLRDSTFEIQTADLSKNELPSLEDAQELPIDLCGNYWTPEHAGEFKKMFLWKSNHKRS